MRLERRLPMILRRLAGSGLLAAALAMAAPASAKDATVSAAQRALKEFGYGVGAPDGVIGRRTRDALRDFQRAHGLAATGELDEATRERLAALDPAVMAPSAASAPFETPTPPSRRPAPATALASAPDRSASRNPVAPSPGASQGSSPIVWILALGGAAWFLLARRRRRSAARAAPPAATSWSSVPIFAGAASVRHTPAAPSRTASSPAGVDARGRPCWLAADETITIAGHAIRGGLLYVGRSSPSPVTGEDNCVVDPSLPVSNQNPDTAGATVPYFPSYQRISPQARLAYLLWLASGRSDPSANIGYVFLYFYGLERRLFLDRAGPDAPAIVAEVERLLAIYGGNVSFARYAGELLSAAQLLSQEASFADHPPAVQGPSWEVPMALRVALGRRVGAGRPLTGEWMLAWLQSDPETRLRTPARRAAAEFRSLFCVRFEGKHPGGLTVKPPKARLKPVYRLATAYQNVQLPIGDVPDVTTIRGPMNEARSIAEACVDALDAYSRLLGRHPDKAGSLEAMLLLPPEIRGGSASDAFREAAMWVEAATPDGGMTIVLGRELLARLGFDVASKPGRPDAARLADALRALGAGLEPDPAFGSGVVAIEEPAVLFRLPSDAASTPSETYGGMWLLISIAAAVALADGNLSAEERHALDRRIDAARHLPDSERVRLKAHVRRLERKPAHLSSFKSRIAALPESERREVARFTAGLAAADGRVDPAEIRVLERIYRMLGLDKSLVFSDLHANAAASSAADEPVSIVVAGSPAPGHPIPSAPRPLASREIELDSAKLERIMADTRRVSAVLGAVFEEEPAAEPEPAADEESETVDDLAGLDRHHRSLVETLLSRAAWPADDFGRLARSMDLLPDGALETINEWALERFDEPLLEGGEPLIVNGTLIPPRTQETA